jgi:cytochrome c
LNGVVGREKGSVADYAYSDALMGLGQDWTPENISGFLLNPREYAPGTKMAYRGMSDVEDRANLIAYLATTGG